MIERHLTFNVHPDRTAAFEQFIGGEYRPAMATAPDGLAIFDSHCHAWRYWPYEPPVPDPETADSILLYAGGMPTFVVDTYTYRVLSRHGWIGFDSGYDEIKEHFENLEMLVAQIEHIREILESLADA